MLKTLFLVPTLFELEHLTTSFRSSLANKMCKVELVGFGPIVSGIRTGQLVSNLKPQQVVLLGIAGSLEKTVEVGSAVEFDRVVCYGIGAGSGADFVTSDEMGWSQWNHHLEGLGTDTIGCNLSLEALGQSEGKSDLGGVPRKTSAGTQLLTSCAASASALEAQQKRLKFPDAIAEDMEGFAVAVACRLSNTPLRILRGISNMAGDRDSSRWRVAAAMQAVEKMISSL